MSEYIIVNNDKSTESTNIHPSPLIKPLSSSSSIHSDNLSIQPSKPTGYRSTLTTPCGKPLFNCLLQHNPEPTILQTKNNQHMKNKIDFKNIPKNMDDNFDFKDLLKDKDELWNNKFDFKNLQKDKVEITEMS